MDEKTDRIHEEPADAAASIRTADATADEGALLSAFFAEAAEIEPADLPTPGQLRWRAELLARLASEERRAARAGSPAIAGGIVVALAALTVLALFFSGIEVGIVATLGRWLVATPWRPLLIVAFTLSLTGCVAGFGLRRMTR